MKANDVFISYSSKNTQEALIVKKLLQDHGITCWMAPDSIPAGSNYTKEIPYGILYSKMAVLILSNASLNSIWVNHEIEYLLNAEHIVIPFLIEDLSNNSNKNEKPFSDLFSNNEFLIKYENMESLQKLLLIVQQQLGGISTSKVPDTSDDLLQLGLKDIIEDGGVLLDNGRGEYYLTKSAELGNSVAMRLLAKLYDIGDEEEAEQWWKKAAKLGDIPSITRNAYRLLSKHNYSTESLREATNSLKMVVNEGNQEALYLYSELLLNEDNPYYDPIQARSILERIFENGYNEAALLLGDIYHYAKGVKETAYQAFRYYQIASSSEDCSLASLKLADCYFEGYGTEKNMKKAFKLYGDNFLYSSEYQEKYADCFYYGYGTHIDKGNALSIYRLIAINDDFETLVNSEFQLRVLNKRSELNDCDAILKLADVKYQSGEYNQAFSLYSKSSENNNPEAFLGLALCYLNGYGTVCDYKQAFSLLSKSYSLKCRKAARYLAKCYELGFGTARNQSFAEYFKSVDNFEDNLWSLSIM